MLTPPLNRPSPDGATPTSAIPRTTRIPAELEPACQRPPSTGRIAAASGALMVLATDTFAIGADAFVIGGVLPAWPAVSVSRQARPLPPTGKQMDAPCCDVFEVIDGKIMRFDCHPEGTIILTQLGVIGNLSAALKH